VEEARALFGLDDAGAPGAEVDGEVLAEESALGDAKNLTDEEAEGAE
jgi:hypothetical protein